MSELYAICRLSHIADGFALGMVLARKEGQSTKPWPLLVTRKGSKVYGFENACPHQGTRLDTVAGQFLDADGNFITCGKHGAQFDLDTGHCFLGPCQGQRLTPIDLVIDDGDVCLSGVELAEEDGLDLPEQGPPDVMITAD